MKITPIKNMYLHNDKVQICYKKNLKGLLFNKDEIVVPIGKSFNSFSSSNYDVIDFELNKLYYRLIHSQDGYTSDFVVFTKNREGVFMIDLDSEDIKREEDIITTCDLAEKDRLINGLKKPNTVIFQENIGQIYFNSLPGEEYLDKNKTNIDLFDSSNYAITFLSDAQVKITNFSAIMNKVNEYSVEMRTGTLDLSRILQSFNESNKFYGLVMEDYLRDPPKYELREIAVAREKKQRENLDRIGAGANSNKKYDDTRHLYSTHNPEFREVKSRFPMEDESYLEF